MENATHERDTAQGKDSTRTRRQAPRFGAFVTITAALLMLFGAASRFGNMPEPSALFGIDQQAERTTGRDGEILRTAIILGSVPVQRNEVAPPVNTLDFDPNVLPPSRGDFGIDNRLSGSSNNDGMPVLSIPHQISDDQDYGFVEPNRYIPPAPGGYVEVENSQPAFDQPQTYTVAAGDTWVKVAKRTLGDSNRWREIMNLNPVSRNGLRVGMELRIPQN